MRVVYRRIDQTSVGGFDDLDGLWMARKDTVVSAAVVEPKLLAYSSDTEYLPN